VQFPSPTPLASNPPPTPPPRALLYSAPHLLTSTSRPPQCASVCSISDFAPASASGAHRKTRVLTHVLAGAPRRQRNKALIFFLASALYNYPVPSLLLLYTITLYRPCFCSIQLPSALYNYPVASLLLLYTITLYRPCL
jgi:hypothetical protein